MVGVETICKIRDPIGPAAGGARLRHGHLFGDLVGFPPFLKGMVEKQLFRQGVAAHFSSIRLDVLRGVIAKEAVLAYAKAPEQTLARIDEVQIDWNWPLLLHGQNGDRRAADRQRLRHGADTGG